MDEYKKGYYFTFGKFFLCVLESCNYSKTISFSIFKLLDQRQSPFPVISMSEKLPKDFSVSTLKEENYSKFINAFN